MAKSGDSVRAKARAILTLSKDWREPDWRGRERIEEYFDRLKLVRVQIKRDHGWDTHYGIFDEETAEYVPVLNQATITTSPGSTQSYKSDATWNNSNNSVECVGSGASGAVSGAGSWLVVTGGGGGSYSKITNFTFATPGTTTATVEVAAGGYAHSTNGNEAGYDGNPTWFNSATDPGNGTDNTKCSAAGGKGGLGAAANTIVAGGAGGLTTASWGQTKRAGGNGGGATAASYTTAAAGGGGAGGPTGAGSIGVNISASNSATAGGGADAGGSSPGTGSAGVYSSSASAASSNGGAGNEWSTSSVGCGGGSGGCYSTGALAVNTSGTGGLYGGGSGAAGSNASSSSPQANAGGQGIIVLTWTPAAGVIGGRKLNVLLRR